MVAIAVVALTSACGTNPLSTPSCTVGLASTDLQVTAEGASAQSFCDSFVSQSNGSGYSVDQPDTSGTLMCRYILSDGTAITVRDKGLLKAYGTSECQILANAVATPS